MSQSKPAVRAEVVTPSNTVNLPLACRSLYVGTGGDLSVEMLDGPVKTVVFPNILDGSTLAVQCTRVNSTRTTASGIVALF